MKTSPRVTATTTCFGLLRSRSKGSSPRGHISPRSTIQVGRCLASPSPCPRLPTCRVCAMVAAAWLLLLVGRLAPTPTAAAAHSPFRAVQHPLRSAKAGVTTRSPPPRPGSSTPVAAAAPATLATGATSASIHAQAAQCTHAPDVASVTKCLACAAATPATGLRTAPCAVPHPPVARCARGAAPAPSMAPAPATPASAAPTAPLRALPRLRATATGAARATPSLPPATAIRTLTAPPASCTPPQRVLLRACTPASSCSWARTSTTCPPCERLWRRTAFHSRSTSCPTAPSACATRTHTRCHSSIRTTPPLPTACSSCRWDPRCTRTPTRCCG
mmetsp:Transcript_20176/g.64361  ORF Transcript_20176/g.64361 Transcript_20176/m.64361 type:complete len:332 (+) Transcript_20176:242-1237(+)